MTLPLLSTVNLRTVSGPRLTGALAALDGNVADDGATVPTFASVTPAGIYDASLDITIYAYEKFDTARREVISYYRHADGLAPDERWGPPYIDTLIPAREADYHGVPAICFDHERYLHVFGGSHTTEMQHSSTDDPVSALSDLETWISRTEIAGDHGYPKPVSIGNKIYLFTRGSQSSNNALKLTIGTASGGVITWGASSSIIDMSGVMYAGNFIAVGTEIWFVLHIGQTTRREHLYFFRYDTVTGQLKNYAGTFSTSSFPINLSTGNTNFRLYAHASGRGSFDIPSFFLAAGNRPHILFADGPESEFGPFDIKYMYDPGSGTFLTEDTGCSTDWQFGTAGIVPLPNGRTDMIFHNDGNLYIAQRKAADDWAEAKRLLSRDTIDPIARVIPVQNGLKYARWFLSKHLAGSVAADFNADVEARMKCWLYGTSGLLRRTDVSPSNVAIPTISGRVNVGEILTAIPGRWSAYPSDLDYAYTWENNGTPIGGATDQIYTPVSGDEGDDLSVNVDASNRAGNADEDSVAIEVGPELTATDFFESETEGLSLRFSSEVPQVSVIDTGTPANDKDNVGVMDWFATFGESPKLCRKDDGVYRYNDHNLIKQSEDFSTTWTNTATTDTASSITETTGNTLHDIRQSGISVVVSGTYTFSVEVMRDGRDYCYIAIDDGSPHYSHFNINAGTVVSDATGNTSSITDIGGGWFRIRTERALANNAQMWIGLTNDGSTISYAGNASVNLHLRKAHVFRGNVGDSTGYIQTTTAVRIGPPMHYDPVYGWMLLLEPTRQNLTRYCRDLTQSNWTKTNTTASKNQTGIDGKSNRASSLTATAANGTCSQSITSSSADRSLAPFVKRISGTGRLEMSLDGGTSYTNITPDGSAWERKPVRQLSLTNPQIVFRIQTNGDAFGIDFADLVTINSGSDGENEGSPIETFGSAVTRSIDTTNTPTSAFPVGTGPITAYCERISFDRPSVADRIMEISDGTVSNIILLTQNALTDGGRLDVNTGAASQVALSQDYGGGLGPYPQKMHFTAAVDTNDVALSVDGRDVVKDTSCTPPGAALNRLRLLVSSGGAVGFQRILIVTRRVSDGDLPDWRFVE